MGTDTSPFKEGLLKNSMFFTAPQNAGVDSGILDAILVGFALHFLEISVDVAAK